VRERETESDMLGFRFVNGIKRESERQSQTFWVSGLVMG